MFSGGIRMRSRRSRQGDFAPPPSASTVKAPTGMLRKRRRCVIEPFDPLPKLPWSAGCERRHRRISAMITAMIPRPPGYLLRRQRIQACRVAAREDASVACLSLLSLYVRRIRAVDERIECRSGLNGEAGVPAIGVEFTGGPP